MWSYLQKRCFNTTPSLRCPKDSLIRLPDADSNDAEKVLMARNPFQVDNGEVTSSVRSTKFNEHLQVLSFKNYKGLYDDSLMVALNHISICSNCRCCLGFCSRNLYPGFRPQILGVDARGKWNWHCSGVADGASSARWEAGARWAKPDGFGWFPNPTIEHPNFSIGWLLSFIKNGPYPRNGPYHCVYQIGEHQRSIKVWTWWILNDPYYPFDPLWSIVIHRDPLWSIETENLRRIGALNFSHKHIFLVTAPCSRRSIASRFKVRTQYRKMALKVHPAPWRSPSKVVVAQIWLSYITFVGISVWGYYKCIQMHIHRYTPYTFLYPMCFFQGFLWILCHWWMWGSRPGQADRGCWKLQEGFRTLGRSERGATSVAGPGHGMVSWPILNRVVWPLILKSWMSWVLDYWTIGPVLLAPKCPMNQRWHVMVWRWSRQAWVLLWDFHGFKMLQTVPFKSFVGKDKHIPWTSMNIHEHPWTSMNI